MMSLVTAARINAAPTAGDIDAKHIAKPVSPAYAEYSSSLRQEALFNGTIDSSLAKIADELQKPPADFLNPLSLPPGTRPMPAVPATLFMCLAGFLCVTLVRDRKVWLAAATTLLWAGQIGINALPQIASHLISKRQFEHQTNSKLIYVSELQNVDRLRSDLDGTRYIGLLRYLEGIPDTTNSVQRIAHTPNIIRNTKLVPIVVKRYDTRYTNQAIQFALRYSQPFFIPANICLARIAEHSITFSPAFIFNSIPRGPPISL